VSSSRPQWLPENGQTVTGTIEVIRCIDGAYVFSIRTETFCTPYFSIEGDSIRNIPIPTDAAPEQRSAAG